MLSLYSSRTRERYPMARVYADAAAVLADSGMAPVTHCDVRCAVNDLLDALERDGFRVNHSYSQDRAFSTVRKLLA